MLRLTPDDILADVLLVLSLLFGFGLWLAEGVWLFLTRNRRG